MSARDMLVVSRMFYWRVVRGEDGEICKRCGRPVARTCPTYWYAPDWLWNEVEGGEDGIRCIPCFTADCEARGHRIAWVPNTALRDLTDAVRPVLGAYRSTTGHVTERQITAAWAAFDAARRGL